LALAKAGGYRLLTGDGILRDLAADEDVECHGVLWVFDRLEEERIRRPEDLEAALSAIVAHPRCRLPSRHITERLVRYARNSSRE
jgi:hypothetical protein